MTAGPVYEGPDFGDEEELTSLDGAPDRGRADASGESDEDEAAAPASPVQPFAGLPELPDDLADALEQMKLAVLRHKTAGWRDVSAGTVQKYLDAMGVLIRS